MGIIDKIKGKKSEYHTGDLQLIDSYIVDEELNPLIEDFKVVKDAKIISYFVVHSDVDHCIKYTRQKKIFLIQLVLYVLCPLQFIPS